MVDPLSMFRGSEALLSLDVVNLSLFLSTGRFCPVLSRSGQPALWVYTFLPALPMREHLIHSK